MSDWTPGPWEAERDDSLMYGQIVYVVSDAKPRRKAVAIIEGRGAEGTVADARLIAAAPEMAELLQRWLLNYQGVVSDWPIFVTETRDLLSRINTPSERTEE